MTTTNTSLLATAPSLTKEKQLLLHYIDKMVKLTEEEKLSVLESTDIRTFKKGTFLIKEGEIATQCYFNLKGCVRQFYLIDGDERTTNFYTEGESISSALSNLEQTPVKYYLECIEDTTLSVGTQEQEEEMYRRFPRLQSVCRVEVEKKLGLYQEMLASYITTSPEERYLKLLKERPDLLTRVPQYQLASYIGVKPESLSRIRRRISLK